MKTVVKVFVLLITSVVCHAQYQNAFTEVSEIAGIDHAFQVGQATFGGGVAVLDYNLDGFEDLYVTGGDAADKFYKNNGDGTFTNVLEQAGFEQTKLVHTQGVASADINRDGYRDLIITTLHVIATKAIASNLLYLNNGNGTFRDVTSEWGLAELKSNSQGASFGDFNADGFPDLFIANYFSSAPEGIGIYNEATITSSFTAAVDFLLINNAGKGFIDVSKLYGLTHQGFGFIGLFTDFDNDRDADLLIANDFGFKKTPNILLRNDYPTMKFTDRSINQVFNYGMNAMGIAGCDCNNDGWMDYFVTNISASLFVVNKGNSRGFINMAPELGLAIPTVTRPNYIGPPISWGANFFDFDHDTDEDLFVANGALNPTIRQNYNFFFIQEDGVFREVSEALNMDDPRVARGSAVFDYDRDGDLDLFVVNQSPREPTDILPRARSLLYRNNTESGSWLQIALEGVYAEKNGIGSRIELRNEGRLQIREIDGGSSHLSQSSTIAHFGLKDATVVDTIMIKWLGGKTQLLTQVPINQRLTVKELSKFTPDPQSETTLNINPSVFENEFFGDYTLAANGPLEITLIDQNGHILYTLLESEDASQNGFFAFNQGSDLASGIYLVHLKNGKRTTTKKIVKY